MKKIILLAGVGLMSLTAAGQEEQNQTHARPAQKTAQVAEESSNLRAVRRTLHNNQRLPVQTTMQPSRSEEPVRREGNSSGRSLLRAVKRK